VARLLADGATVYVDLDDLRALGLPADRLLDGVRGTGPDEVTRRWPEYERVWFM
jgi:hypothetical protein